MLKVERLRNNLRPHRMAAADGLCKRNLRVASSPPGVELTSVMLNLLPQRKGA